MYVLLGGADNEGGGGPGAEVELELVVHDPEATEADLARALGRPVPPSPRRLVDLGLLAGDPLSNLPPDRARSGRDVVAGSWVGPGVGSAEVAVVGGLDAGSRVAIRAGGPPVAVGRGAGA